jgi:hypothetical protein
MVVRKSTFPWVWKVAHSEIRRFENTVCVTQDGAASRDDRQCVIDIPSVTDDDTVADCDRISILEKGEDRE